MTRDELRTRRDGLKLSQAQLAAALVPPVHRDTVGGWETGAIPISVPRAMWLDAELKRLARRRPQPAASEGE